jgi:hypothetical protein
VLTDYLCLVLIFCMQFPLVCIESASSKQLLSNIANLGVQCCSVSGFYPWFCFMFLFICIRFRSI